MFYRRYNALFVLSIQQTPCEPVGQLRVSASVDGDNSQLCLCVCVCGWVQTRYFLPLLNVSSNDTVNPRHARSEPGERTLCLPTACQHSVNTRTVMPVLTFIG